jgi:hypothetical protein
MPLPDFFLIGAPKSGTTALYRALRRHPDIYMPALKEPHYFSHDPAGPDWARRRSTRRQRAARVTTPLAYFRLFSQVSGQRAIGEASTSYLRSELAARRIREQLPEAKLIAVLRHPVERAYSSYWFYVSIGVEVASSFEDAVDPSRPRRGPMMGDQHMSHGFYHAHLSRWFSLFAREQIRIYLHEELCMAPESVLHDLLGFLGVDPSVGVGIPHANATRISRAPQLHRLAVNVGPAVMERALRRFSVTPPPMQPQTWRSLLERYRLDIENLQTLIDRDLSHWLDRQAVEAMNVAA